MTQQIQIAIIAQTETVASPNEAAAHTREVELEIGVEHQTLVQLRAELDHQWAIVDRVEFPCDHKESLEAFRHTRELRVASEKYNQFRQPRLRKPRSKELRTNVPALKNPP